MNPESGALVYEKLFEGLPVGELSKRFQTLFNEASVKGVTKEDFGRCWGGVEFSRSSFLQFWYKIGEFQRVRHAASGDDGRLSSEGSKLLEVAQFPRITLKSKVITAHTETAFLRLFDSDSHHIGLHRKHHSSDTWSRIISAPRTEEVEFVVVADLQETKGLVAICSKEPPAVFMYPSQDPDGFVQAHVAREFLEEKEVFVEPKIQAPLVNERADAAVTAMVEAEKPHVFQPAARVDDLVNVNAAAFVEPRQVMKTWEKPGPKRVELIKDRQANLRERYGIVETILFEGVSTNIAIGLEAALRILFNRGQIEDHLLAEVVDYCSNHPVSEQLGFEEVFPVNARYNRFLEPLIQKQDNFKNFGELLRQIKKRAVDTKQSVAAVLTKPPESVTLFFIYDDFSCSLRPFLLDPHGRPDICGPYGGILAFNDSLELEQFVQTHVWTFIEFGPDEAILSEMFNSVDVNVLARNKSFPEKMNVFDETVALSFLETSGDKKEGDKVESGVRCECYNVFCGNAHMQDNRERAMDFFIDSVGSCMVEKPKSLPSRKSSGDSMIKSLKLAVSKAKEMQLQNPGDPDKPKQTQKKKK
eukprot:TRINITY_DN3095_c0_g1_i2.p1 TRINITY_DN3095_c0_g1~~TRINITY_DN3095_c0_g1_i2.p1  ORF type:complete len:586 (-),score=147.60 TRINITY_DN3095_c0_g1_i2:3497-5254(-)